MYDNDYNHKQASSQSIIACARHDAIVVGRKPSNCLDIVDRAITAHADACLRPAQSPQKEATTAHPQVAMQSPHRINTKARPRSRRRDSPP